MTWKPLQDDDEPVRLAASLEQYTKTLGGAPVDVMRSLFDEWGALIGDSVAGHATPTSLKDGVLTLQTPDPAWARQLGFLAKDLMQRINASLGEGVVREIEVRVARR